MNLIPPVQFVYSPPPLLLPRRGRRVGVKLVADGVLGGPDVVFEVMEVGDGDVEEADGWVCKELQNTLGPDRQSAGCWM